MLTTQQRRLLRTKNSLRIYRTRFSNLKTLLKEVALSRTNSTTIVIRTTSNLRKYAIQYISIQSYSINAIARIYYLRYSKSTSVLGLILALVIVIRISRLEIIRTSFDKSRERYVRYTLRGQTTRKSFGFNALYTYISTTLRRSLTIIISQLERLQLIGYLS